MLRKPGIKEKSKYVSLASYELNEWFDCGHEVLFSSYQMKPNCVFEDCLGKAARGVEFYYVIHCVK